MVRLRVERVVNGMTAARTERQIVLHDRIPAAISEDEIVLRNKMAKRIVWIGFHTRQRGRSVHIPERDLRALTPASKHAVLKQLIVCADTTVLNDEVVGRGERE